MYINAAYLNNSLIDFKDKSKPLVVGSCGTYRLYKHPRLPTHRPRGRLDFQILYIASGKVHFYFDNSETDHSDMSILVQIKQKYSGFISQAEM